MSCGEGTGSDWLHLCVQTVTGDTKTLTPSWMRDFHVCSSFLMSLSDKPSDLFEPVQLQISTYLRPGEALKAPSVVEEQGKDGD